LEKILNPHLLFRCIFNWFVRCWVYSWISIVALCSYGVCDVLALWKGQGEYVATSAFLFGWVGAIVGQHKLRHKTQKHSFRLIIWGTVLFNVVYIGWLHTDSGGQFLHTSIHGLQGFV